MRNGDPWVTPSNTGSARTMPVCRMPARVAATPPTCRQQARHRCAHPEAAAGTLRAPPPAPACVCGAARAWPPPPASRSMRPSTCSRPPMAAPVTSRTSCSSATCRAAGRGLAGLAGRGRSGVGGVCLCLACGGWVRVCEGMCQRRRPSPPPHTHAHTCQERKQRLRQPATCTHAGRLGDDARALPWIGIPGGGGHGRSARVHAAPASARRAGRPAAPRPAPRCGRPHAPAAPPGPQPGAAWTPPPGKSVVPFRKKNRGPGPVRECRSEGTEHMVPTNTMCHVAAWKPRPGKGQRK